MIKYALAILTVCSLALLACGGAPATPDVPGAPSAMPSAMPSGAPSAMPSGAPAVPAP